jgi:lactate racemase
VSVWLRMGRDTLRLDLLDRWQRPPVVAPHRGTIRARVREAAGITEGSLSAPPVDLDALLAAGGLADAFLAKAAAAKTVCLVIPDATRRGPWQWLCDETIRWTAALTPLAARRVLLLATGVHRPLIPPDLQCPAGWQLLANGAGGYDDHRDLGSTPAGTHVRLHPAWVEADLRVVLGDLSFHYFAGFGGGRKLVFPGLGEPRGILENHKRCLQFDGTLHPGCESGRLHGNPVHEDILDAVSLCAPDLLVQAYEPSQGEAPLPTAGHWRESHERGCAGFLAGHTLEFTQKPDLLIADAGGWPRDASMLQAHKSLRHAARFLSPGGRLLLVAGLEEGSGSETFERLWSLPSRDLSQRAVENYELHTHTALSMRTICEEFEVAILSRMEPQRLVSSGVRPLGTVGEALEWLEERGRSRAWGWLARAEEVIPRLVGQGGDG